MIKEIINKANVYLVAKDQNHRFTYFNEKFAELLDLISTTDAIGKTDFDFFPECFASFYQRGDSCVLKGGVYTNCTEQIVRRDNGKTLDILVSKNVYLDKKGEVDGIIVSFVDTPGVALNSSKGILFNFEFNADQGRYYFPYSIPEYFTRREFQVFSCFFQGVITAKQIGKQLDISPRTVEKYVASILIKLQCSCKHDIVRTAMLMGLAH